MPTDPMHPLEGYVIASAAFGDPLRTVDCLARIDGAGGAMLKLSDPDLIPSQFLLVALSIQIRHPCKVVERFDALLRVKFLRG